MTVARASVASRLAAIAGNAHVSADPTQLAPYAIDGKTPAAVARPGSAEEAAEIVKFAAAESLAIVPAGARTKLSMGMPPREYDLALDVSRLDRVVAYDPGDLTLGVEAGIPLRTLAATLAEHRQFLPLAPPFMNRATAGGTIASGVDSPLRQFYGAARDYVLGMEFITGDGALVKERRARGEKRGGLRPAQIDDRRAGHARRNHKNKFPHVSAARVEPDVRGGLRGRRGRARHARPRGAISAHAGDARNPQPGRCRASRRRRSCASRGKFVGREPAFGDTLELRCELRGK